MKTKYGKWSTVSRFFQTLRFKSALVAVVSLFAIIKLTAQNQNPPSPPVVEATPAGAMQEQASHPTNESFQFVILPNGAMTMRRLAPQSTNATATPGSPAAPSPAETQPATVAPASLQTTPTPTNETATAGSPAASSPVETQPATSAPASLQTTPMSAASDDYHWDPFERHTKAAPAPASSARQPATPQPATPQPAAPQPAAPQPAASQAAASTGDAMVMPSPLLQAPKPTKNEISVSGDVMMGQGTVTLPLGYSLKQSLGGIVPTPVSAFSVPRSSTYYGGTVSYSYGQAWYVDLSFAQGQSSGSQTIDTGWLGPLNSTFSIDDTWYQLYVKYTFPQLRGKRFSAYLRAGASYINSELKDNSTSYTQKDTTQDLLGNLGGGLGYTVYSSRHLRFGLQTEIEGFYGNRSQSSLETLEGDHGLTPTSASINNSLYGGIGRATMRLEYRLGQSGLFKIFGEAGAEGRYTMISYPGAGTKNELLWGPYAKLGIRYAF
jgi:hypothetical protein